MPESATSQGLCQHNALARRLLEGGDRGVGPDRATMAKDICNGFRRPENQDRNAFDLVGRRSVAEELVGEPDNAQRRRVDLGLPVFGADGDPNPARQLIRDAVDGECRVAGRFRRFRLLPILRLCSRTAKGSALQIRRSPRPIR